jgi:dihydrofolate reductase
MKITYYVASSLDGYIAKEDGDVSWLDELAISLEETGYDEFYSTVDALVMG